MAAPPLPQEGAGGGFFGTAHHCFAPRVTNPRRPVMTTNNAALWRGLDGMENDEVRKTSSRRPSKPVLTYEEVIAAFSPDADPTG